MKYLSFLLFAVLVLAACKKDDDQAIVDEEIILAYCKTNALEATKDPSGIYYIIYNQGSGGHPTGESTVEVQYKGYLTDGSVFDKTSGNSTVSFPLTNLIEGWKIAIPMLQKGGNGLFLIPSALGYGSQTQLKIPANSVLIFEITLVDF